jgi:hypothetical protein
MNIVDINFDFRLESNKRDPDRWSPTLQEYHRIIWSKLLPSGKVFTLNKISQNRLYHKSELGEFHLSSDMAFYGFIRKCHRTEFIASQIPELEIKNFERLTLNTLGGTLIWPSIRINNKMTINGARGFNRLIADRLDLTIECIRRYYLDEDSPLYIVFKRYSEFFALFDNFRGYIDFFLLQDFIDENDKVKFSTPFNNFEYPPLPITLNEYLEFRKHTTELTNCRNKRIQESIKNT